METIVYHRGPANFDMTGKFLGYPLTKTQKKISLGLAERITKYSVERLQQSGFPIFGIITVEKIEGDQVYTVLFENEKGGVISVCGILINKGGWPYLDHGFDISVKRWS